MAGKKGAGGRGAARGTAFGTAKSAAVRNEPSAQVRQSVTALPWPAKRTRAQSIIENQLFFAENHA